MSQPRRAEVLRMLRVLTVVGGVVVLGLGAIAFAMLRSGSAAPAYSPASSAPATAAVPSPAATRGLPASRSVRRSPSIDPAWLAATAAATGIPAPALRGYAEAQLRLGREQPDCHLGWNTLAGIGWIESHHGTVDGRVLRADGRSSRTVLGPALDGTRFAAIRSTPASAAWHGDRTWEHAVGPLQFLASTWQRWGADGDGDGSADPRDIDDAALAAGRYLCADAHDLSTDSGWTRAVHSYNHDMSYVVSVARAATTYAARAR